MWLNSKIILITRWDLNIFLLQTNPLKFLSALNLLIIVIALITMLMNAKPQPTKTQKQESKPHSQFLLNSQINSYSLFTASTLSCCIVCAGFCVPVIMQNGSLSSVGHLFCRLGGYEEQKELWSCERLQGVSGGGVLFCMQKRCCDGSAWKLAGYRRLCWAHYAKIYIKKKNPFSFKMELKMCWFCLYWTLPELSWLWSQPVR